MISQAERSVRPEELEPGDLAIIDDARFRVDSATKTADGIVLLGAKQGQKRRVRLTVPRHVPITVVADGITLLRLEQALVDAIRTGNTGRTVAPPVDGDAALLITDADSGLGWEVPLRTRVGAVLETPLTATEEAELDGDVVPAGDADASATMSDSLPDPQEVPTPA